MNGREKNGHEGVRRVLVALELGRHSDAALAAAARLAGSTAAELVALFVEDENLHRIAALPVTRVLGYRTATQHELDAETMARALEAQAERVAALVRAAANRVGVPSRFRVARGKLAPAIVEASSDADLVLLGKGRPPSAWAHVAAITARVVAERAHRPVLLVSEDRAVGPPAVVYDGTPSGERALAAAAYLEKHAGEETIPIVVLAAGATPAAARSAGRTAREWLEARGLSARVTPLPAPNASAVLRALASSHARTLVVGADWPPGPADFLALLEDAPVPVMIAG